jgi:hypothetical protein
MNRWSLLLATTVCLVFTGWLTDYSNRLPSHSLHASPRRVGEVEGTVHSFLATEAGWRWRNCEPKHWRACLLQH